MKVRFPPGTSEIAYSSVFVKGRVFSPRSEGTFTRLVRLCPRPSSLVPGSTVPVPAPSPRPPSDIGPRCSSRSNCCLGESSDEILWVVVPSGLKHWLCAPWHERFFPQPLL